MHKYSNFIKIVIINIKSKYLKLILSLIILLAVILLIYSIYIFNIAFKPNIKLTGKKEYYLKIPSNSDYSDVIRILKNDTVLKNSKTFDKLARKKNYPNYINPGRYLIKNNMSNNRVINLLRSGKQQPFNLIFNNIRTKERLAQVISNQIEADSASIMEAMHDSAFLSLTGFNEETVLALFIPNTYQFYWNTTAERFLNRMLNEYHRFWKNGRAELADEIGLSPVEVSTLAAIIDEEALINDELKRIAGVYMNRLEKRMYLNADPTIKFILRDFSVRRILYKDLEINSPYNTYKKIGLPPGPIVIPSIAAIDAVLNYEKHDYLYFCAKEDFSGYHNFAKTLEEHNRNRRLYLQALNKSRIYR